MLFDSEVSFANLIRITDSGFFVATYPEIVNMLTIRYKEIYGNDIDLSPTTADGVFIHNIALLINNILQGFQLLKNNLDVDVAQGEFLENLCKLSNIYRKPATNSYVTVSIHNRSNSVSLDKVSCVDVNGIIWTSKTPLDLAFGETKPIILYCEQSGPVKAVAGSILQVVNIPPATLLSIQQDEDAIPGSNAESDAELRARRAMSNSPIGINTLESMIGVLLQIPAVKDCLIYNNTNDIDVTVDGVLGHRVDGTFVPVHNIYITLRTDGTEEDDDIGEAIYYHITPGIETTETESTTGDSHSKVNYPKVFGTEDQTFEETVYWKVAKRQCPPISITLQNGTFISEAVLDDVAAQLIDWLNNLPLNSTVTKDDIILQLSEYDPLINGQRTYIVNNASINSAQSYTNTYAYFNYKNTATTSVGSTTSTITIAQEVDA